jgi:hypothetical protein
MSFRPALGYIVSSRPTQAASGDLVSETKPSKQTKEIESRMAFIRNQGE